MSNHYHLVLHVDADRARKWTDSEVVTRWRRLFPIGSPDQPAPVANYDKDLVDLWRTRLADLSWFMRTLNEPISRQANREDGCKGHFWDGRYKCRALLDEAALLACMAYVDLNPVHARICKTLEESDFTSVQARIQQRGRDAEPLENRLDEPERPAALMPFERSNDDSDSIPVLLPARQHLPFKLTDYLDVVDWAGRAHRDDKKGWIPEHIPPILARFNVEPEIWLGSLGRFDERFSQFAGTIPALRRLCRDLKRRWVKGIRFARTLTPRRV